MAFFKSKSGNSIGREWYPKSDIGGFNQPQSSASNGTTGFDATSYGTVLSQFDPQKVSGAISFGDGQTPYADGSTIDHLNNLTVGSTLGTMQGSANSIFRLSNSGKRAVELNPSALDITCPPQGTIAWTMLMAIRDRSASNNTNYVDEVNAGDLLLTNNGGHWHMVSGTTSDNIDGGAIDENWHIFAWVCAADQSQVDLYIDGTFEGTINRTDPADTPMANFSVSDGANMFFRFAIYINALNGIDNITPTNLTNLTTALKTYCGVS